MLTHIRNTPFANIAQRAVYAYLTSLVKQPVQTSADLEIAAPQFQNFLRDLYTLQFQSPEQFGLPVTEDLYIVGDEKDPKQFKQDVTRRLNKPKILLERGMDFLMNTGRQGILEDTSLLLGKKKYAELLKEFKIKKMFLQGLEFAGLIVTEAEDTVTLTCAAYPEMMPAFKKLAIACSQYDDLRLGRFNFARADFRALGGQFSPSALDLYATCDPIDFDQLQRLDEFFIEEYYRPLIQIYGIRGWEVQYQGPTKIKASPLLRIHYDLRHKIPLQVKIKCASTNRIINLVYKQPRLLQEDFSRRVYICKGDTCNWCADKKGLGPSVFEFDGLTRTICWYHDSSVPELNENTLHLIKQYTLMHAELAEAI